MAEASRGKDASAERDKNGPDYYGYYTHEVAYLLSQTEDYMPCASRTSDLAERTRSGKEGNCSGAGAGALFCDAVGASVSDFKKERLNALLWQSVPLLTQEIVEMEEPIIALQRIQRCKEEVSTCPSTNCEDTGENLYKKPKLCSSSSSRQSTSLTSSCDRNIQVNDDLQVLLKTEPAKVEESMKRMSSELSEKLECKKKKLECLLDTVMSSCRPMTLLERQQLRNLIFKLPHKNLNRVVELIKRSHPLANSTHDEIFVGLEDMITRHYGDCITMSKHSRMLENCLLWIDIASAKSLYY